MLMNSMIQTMIRLSATASLLLRASATTTAVGNVLKTTAENTNSSLPVQRIFQKSHLPAVYPNSSSLSTSAMPLRAKRKTNKKTFARKFEPKTDPIVWIDLEMTGLDLTKDTIIEVACVVTDGVTMEPKDEGIHMIIHQPKEVMDNMNDWCKEHHGGSGLTQSVLSSNITISEAQTRLLAYIKKHINVSRSGILAGNSVHVDRQFLCKDMPQVVEYLHYRILDVSSIKELVSRWYPDIAAQVPRKKLAHRAMDDILESINELKWYKEHVFVQDDEDQA